jgi:hypothetical protein
MAAFLLGGLAGYALSRSQTNQLQCQQCGHTFRPFAGVGSRPTTVWEWLFCFVILSVGVCLIGLYLFTSSFGTTPEADLTLAEGVASDIKVVQLPGGGGTAEVLKFTVAGYHTEYSSYRPKYQGVLTAVRSGRPIRVWVSAKQETLFPRQGWVPLYKLNVGDSPVLGYSDVVGDHVNGSQAFLIGAGIAFAMGAVAIFFCYRNYRRYRAWAATKS